MDRLRQIYNILVGNSVTDSHLLIRDNRTNKSYHIPITSIPHSYLLQSDQLTAIKDSHGKPLRFYDPGYKNTLSAASSICFIDSLRGRLEYRGYPIAQLAARSSFIETSFLLIYGELPGREQLETFSLSISTCSLMHKDVERTVRSFRRDANPMGVLISCLYAISTLYPEANPAIHGEQLYSDVTLRNCQIQRLMGILPTLVARIYRHVDGQGPVQSRPDLPYVENFLHMLGRPKEQRTEERRLLVKAIQTLWIVHAEHQSSCSTALIRHMSSSGVDVFTTIAAGAGALSGAKHGGASAAVIHMLKSIGSRQNIPRFLVEVREKRRLLFGFGHRIYRDNDPRATIVRQVVSEIFRIQGKEPLVGLAIELQRIALADQYFITRKLYPNVDFYTAIVYHSMGLPSTLFPLLYSIPRIAGWLAHWVEFQGDPQSKLVRPRQNYQGHGKRAVVEMGQRQESGAMMEATTSSWRVRRDVSKKFEKNSNMP